MEEVNSEVRQFPTFVAGTAIGLFRAAITEPEIFCLVIVGWLLGSSSARQRGFGKALAGWIIARQADKYVGVFDSNLRRLSRVIGDEPLHHA